MGNGRMARVVASLALTLVALAWMSAPAQEPKRPRGEKYALLVGVRQYDPNELRALPYSEADVVDLAGVLKDAGYRRVVVMTQTEGAKNFRRLPAGANVRKELRGLLEDCEPADTVLVVFAGHGVQFRGEDANYFCPMDARLADRTTLISLKEVYRDLEGCGAGTKLLLVDACRNDPQSDNSRARATVNLESVTRPQAGRPPGGIAALFSCSEGQKAYEHDSLKHGVFFHFVIRGLKGEADLDGDGAIDLEELALYARKRVQSFVKDEYGADVRQVPVLKGEVAGLSALMGEGRAAAKGEPKLASRTPTEMPRPSPPSEGRKTITNTIGMTLVRIDAGEFQMGSGDDDKDAEADEKPRHRVRITRPFYLGTTEVTVGQFRKVVESSGYRTEPERDGKGGGGWNSEKGEAEGRDPKYSWRFTGWVQTDAHPVVNVTWNDAIAYCNALSKLEGLKPYYAFGAGAQSVGDGYRLPTEAEWEYACRAGSTMRDPLGEDPATLTSCGWFADNSGRDLWDSRRFWIDSGENAAKYLGEVGRHGCRSHPVGQKSPNALGLYDMHGNVWEWCWDGYDADSYQGMAVADPSGPLQAAALVYRGGGWHSSARHCRAADRTGRARDYRDFDLGFRVARVGSGP